MKLFISYKDRFRAEAWKLVLKRKCCVTVTVSRNPDPVSLQSNRVFFARTVRMRGCNLHILSDMF